MPLDTTLPTDLQTQVDDYFATLGQGFNAGRIRQERTTRLIALNAMTDAELAQQGLTRAEIPNHVFGDMFPK
ncbi:hypothetical protein AN189_15300 [Loktanella sp. 3ANDIMAR09]|uniref:DUF1127 domain-containing protein n=1 Tax=Loktanella sp. 3ANDIMAR09 TaxID=1225657 RepID=UPI0006FFEBF7|nr:DUF1127 domain-containing protein [Loktanella sp. 3ANDIMAR09]KQI67501.1 hypothetical protein AN189_15300 [Loktanella sp. 3ANDIMAR09]